MRGKRKAGAASIAALMSAVLVAILCLAFGAVSALAETGGADSKPFYKVPNQVCWYYSASVGIDSSAEVFDFADCPDWVDGQGAHRVHIFNSDGSNNMLARLYKKGESVAAGALTTPADLSETKVLDVPPADLPPITGYFTKIKLQSKTAAVAAAVMIEY